MNSKLNLIVRVGGYAVGLIGIGYAIGSRKKLNDICKRLDRSVEQLSCDMEIDISDSIVNDAIDTAVQKEVDRMVERAHKRVIKDIERDMNQQIRQVIDGEYKNLKDDITTKMSKEVSRINTRDIQDEIVDKAKKEVAKKFDGCLDDILEKYNHDLDNVSKIYKSIAQTMSRGNDKEMIFKM